MSVKEIVDSGVSDYYSLNSESKSPDLVGSGRSFNVIDEMSKKNLALGSLCKGSAWAAAGVGIPIIFSVGSLWTLTFLGFKTIEKSRVPSTLGEHLFLLSGLTVGASALTPTIFLSVAASNRFMEYCMENARKHFDQSSLCNPNS